MTGTAYMSNDTDLAITVSAEEGKLRLWRNTALANQTPGSIALAAAHRRVRVGRRLGQWIPAGWPRPFVDDNWCSSAVSAGLRQHDSAGVNDPSPDHVPGRKRRIGLRCRDYPMGLGTGHQSRRRRLAGRHPNAASNRQHSRGHGRHSNGSRYTGMVQATKSTDTSAPTAIITAPAAGNIGQGSTVTVTGTATDGGGGVVAGVEVSLDGGTSWHPASGQDLVQLHRRRYRHWLDAVKVRAIDDSGNIQSPATVAPVTSNCPCSILVTWFRRHRRPAIRVRSHSVRNSRVRPTDSSPACDSTRDRETLVPISGRCTRVTAQCCRPLHFTNESAVGWQTALIAIRRPYHRGRHVRRRLYRAQWELFCGLAVLCIFRQDVERAYCPWFLANNNGVYTTGAGMPGDSYQQTNYYVDALYSASDTTPYHGRHRLAVEWLDQCPH